uniref:Serine aminopeptidase S33 domain-containing protein n=1 Tax=Hanusia phi TaxID=3032 RepID=A0A6T7NFG8_9CRYP|mmetsp:Transcript_15040/g.34589  ORF Transcript_15040/g.34589 Transcript_15040/m.34589 type:complete len:321 (+) Transcript_15040:253-1215(+)
MGFLSTITETVYFVAETFNPFWFLPGWFRSWITYAFSTLGMLGSFLALFLYRNQNSLLYHPEVPGVPKDPRENPERYRNPGEWNMPYEDMIIKAEDHTELHCWLIKQPDSFSAPTIVFFQENAGNMGLRLPNMYELWRRLSVNIFMVSYRGYGRSQGVPTEEGLKMDAQAVLNHVSSLKQVDPKKIVILGRSLGGAVGIHITSRNPEKVKGLIVENSFTSIADMVDVLMPFLAMFKSLILRIGWKSIESIQSITTPILFISGSRDELVPPSHMRRLYDAAKSSIYRSWYAVPDGGHNDTCMRNPREYCEKVKEWMVKIGL